MRFVNDGLETEVVSQIFSYSKCSFERSDADLRNAGGVKNWDIVWPHRPPQARDACTWQRERDGWTDRDKQTEREGQTQILTDEHINKRIDKETLAERKQHNYITNTNKQQSVYGATCVRGVFAESGTYVVSAPLRQKENLKIDDAIERKTP